MLKILYQLDDTDNIEANLVAEAANRLGVGEFQFFRLAHNDWYGGEVAPEQLERIFLAYMLQDNVPHFVRLFARNIIQRHDAGELDPEAEEFHQYDAARPAPATKISGFAKVAVVIAFTAFFMGLMLYTYSPVYMDAARCIYPPCPWMQ